MNRFKDYYDRLYLISLLRMLLAPKIQPQIKRSNWSEDHLIQQLHALLNHCKHSADHHGPGWQLSVQRSQQSEAGSGVFLRRSSVPCGTLLTLYPGTIYEPTDPIFFPSLANAYILRLSNGSFIDGKSKGLSKWIYQSLASRDYNGRNEACDSSWLARAHPYGLGQIVNHGNQTASMKLYDQDRDSNNVEPNVCYTELMLTRKNFDLALLPHVPNIKYQSEAENESGEWARRLVGLVTIRNVQENEELLSSYLSVSIEP